MIDMIKITAISMSMSLLKCKLAVLDDVNAGDEWRLKYHEDFARVVEATILQAPKSTEVRND